MRSAVPQSLSPLETVLQMPHNSAATSVSHKHGLNITTVTWEDNGRSKNSCWGPCISDMTLEVEKRKMPIIKNTSNFVDETWDVEIEKIPLVIGNEDGSELRTVTLKYYLEHLREFLSDEKSWAGTTSSLLRENDQHVICSAQACFLPIPKESGEAKFNVAIYNYQSSATQPAVLAIVASANGTSCEVLDGSTQRLYHNVKGQRASYIGQRLSEYRKETGSAMDDDAPMSASEKQQNMLLVIQVPLKHEESRRFGASYGGVKKCKKGISRKAEVDVEDAIIKIGAAEGPHREIRGLPIERDIRFPIRVTMQYYKATSNGAIDDTVCAEISNQLQDARKWAVAISSLVTETTNRTTEHSVHYYPSWWAGFWTQHAPIFPQYVSSDAAAIMLFSNGRFANSNLIDVQEQVLDLLAQGSSTEPAPAKATVTIQPALPNWDVL